MKIEIITRLLDAGYTKEEIKKLLDEYTETEREEETEAKAGAEAEREEETETETEVETETETGTDNGFNKDILEINKKIDNMSKAINKLMNIPLFASIEDIKPIGIDDVISRVLKD